MARTRNTLSTSVTAGATGAIADWNALNTLYNAGGGGAYALVAASNAPTWVQDRADWVCDGTADQTEINDALTTHGAVMLSPGLFSTTAAVAMTSNQRLIGCGRERTTIKRASNVVLLSVYGTDTNTRAWYNSIEHLTLDGNDNTAKGLDTVYASQLHTYSVRIYNVKGNGIHATELWDSHFVNTFVEWSGAQAVTDGTGAAVLLDSSRAASGFGASTDSINEVRFTNLHMEHIRSGAINITHGAGSGTGGPNGIYITYLKTESDIISGSMPFVNIDANTTRIHFEKTYHFAATLLDGSAINVFNVLTNGQVSLRDIYMANAANATVANGILLNTGTTSEGSVDNVRGDWGTTPTATNNPTVAVTAAGGIDISAVRANLGNAVVGYELNADERTKVLTSDVTTTATTAGGVNITGAVGSDLTFTSVIPGTYTVTMQGKYQSSLTTAGPRFGVGGTATASTGQGMVNMFTSATAPSVSDLTAINTTAGTNPGTAATSFQITMWFSIVVTATGTVGVRWNESAASTGTLKAGTTATLTRLR